LNLLPACGGAELIFGKKPGGAADGMDLWMINGESWPNT
jgi:hypothetical protein